VLFPVDEVYVALADFLNFVTPGQDLADVGKGDRTQLVYYSGSCDAAQLYERAVDSDKPPPNLRPAGETAERFLKKSLVRTAVGGM
jgi:hypothetical protein